MKAKNLLSLILYLGLYMSGEAQNKAKPLVKVEIETDFNLVFLPIKVDGNITYMIVDTGAGFSVIDEDVAEAFGLSIENVRIMERPGGDVRLGSISSLDFTVGGYSINMPIASANLAEGGFNDYIGRSCAGILGYDFISRYGFVIDYEKKQLLLYDPSTFDVTGTKKIAFSIVEGMPVIEGTIEHKGALVKGDWLVDTGSLMSLGLNESFFAANLAKNTKQVESLAVGFGGSTPGKMYKLNTFNLAGYNFSDIIAGHAEDGINDETFDGVLGGELLSRFTLAFNYESNEMYISENMSFNGPIRWDLSGMLLAHRKEGIEVLHVYDGSPANDAGILAGDFLVEIDSKKAVDVSLPIIWSVFHYNEAKRISILMKRGDSKYDVELTFKDYFE